MFLKKLAYTVCFSQNFWQHFEQSERSPNYSSAAECTLRVPNALLCLLLKQKSAASEHEPPPKIETLECNYTEN